MGTSSNLGVARRSLMASLSSLSAATLAMRSPWPGSWISKFQVLNFNFPRLRFHLNVKHPRLNLASKLDLDEQSIVSSLWKSIRKRYSRPYGRMRHAGHWLGLAAQRRWVCQRQCGHRNRPFRMDMSENRAIEAQEFCMSRHAHIGFQVLDRLACLVFYPE